MKMADATITVHVDTTEAHRKLEELQKAANALPGDSALYVLRELIQEIRFDIGQVEHLDDPAQRGYVAGLQRAHRLVSKYIEDLKR